MFQPNRRIDVPVKAHSGPQHNPTRYDTAFMGGWHVCVRVGRWMWTPQGGLQKYTRIEVTSRKTGNVTVRHDWLNWSKALRVYP